VREVWSSNPEQINFNHTLPTTHHRCNFEVWPLAQKLRRWVVGHRSLVTPKRVLSDYNENLIFQF